MCGLAGFIDPDERIADPAMAMAVMSEAIRHRGPDGEGRTFDRSRRVALVHRRLAIQDPTENGDQPMTSASGRFTVVYNGEIYDFLERRSELEVAGYDFKTGTDTEVLLAGFDVWGIESTLERLDGMFAFATLDREENRIILARDRAGQKPLLVAEVGGCVAFASDLRALEALPAPFESSLSGIDETSLEWYLRLGVVPLPRSIRPGVEQVPPGGLLRVSLANRRIERGRWWTPPIPASLRDDDYMGASADRDTLDVLRESVHRQCRADREVGVFLSGGLDSRLIAGLANERSPGLPCFTLAMPGPFDESDAAGRIAAQLGCPHHVIRPSDEEICAVAARLPEIADEPFADSSLVATTLLARAAREKIVVALGGDGGDELFGGYRRHLARRRWGRGERWRGVLAGVADHLPRFITGRIPLGRSSLAESIARQLLVHRRDLDYLGLRGKQGDAEEFLGPRPGDPDAFERARRLSAASSQTAPWDGLEPDIDEVRGLMAADFRTYLPDDPLTKLDRGTMSVGLEHRAPLLGSEVIRHANDLPTDRLFDAGGGRLPVRSALKSLGLPIGGSKRGFAVPIFDWLRGPLRDHAASLLLDPVEDPLSPTGVADLFQQVLAGRRDLATPCWTVMCWRAWLRSRRRAPAAES